MNAEFNVAEWFKEYLNIPTSVLFREYFLKTNVVMNIKRKQCQVPVAHACNPSYSGSRHQEDLGSKPAQANSL
jgi:hypothetical protein